MEEENAIPDLCSPVVVGDAGLLCGDTLQVGRKEPF